MRDNWLAGVLSIGGYRLSMCLLRKMGDKKESAGHKKGRQDTYLTAFAV